MKWGSPLGKSTPPLINLLVGRRKSLKIARAKNTGQVQGVAQNKLFLQLVNRNTSLARREKRGAKRIIKSKNGKPHNFHGDVMTFDISGLTV
jgi:hypothetical protein